MTTPSPPALVIDTQTVLDWLVFDDPSTVQLAQALESGQLRWIACQPMLDELLHVLGRGVAAAWHPDLDRIAARYLQHCCMVETPAPGGPRMVCRDPDDQVFIDLAIAQQARWLVSRDKAVLALAKRGRLLHQLEILRLQDWNRMRLSFDGAPVDPPR